MNQENFLNNARLSMAPIMTHAYLTDRYLFNLIILSNIHQSKMKKKYIVKFAEITSIFLIWNTYCHPAETHLGRLPHSLPLL